MDLVDRIQNLLTNESKRVLYPLGLQPLHFKVLRYLSICNKYSNTPNALSRFFGNTKGTTSQTIKVLEKKGYLEKIADEKDKRSIHLYLTCEGEKLLEKVSDELIHKDPESTEIYDTVRALQRFLGKIQRDNSNETFGVCRTCIFFTRETGGFRCGLTHEVLNEPETHKICMEHREKVA